MVEAPRFIDKIAEPLKKVDIVLGTLAFLAGSIGVVALAAVGYFAKDQIQKIGKGK